MQPESTASLVTRICRALSRADGFALYFVLVNLPTARQALALQVKAQLAQPVLEIDVPPEGFGNTTLDGWLLPQLQDAPTESAVFLYGLGHAMPAERVALRRFLQQLNWRRSALKRIARPLVLWLPRHALDSLAEHAPDFYDWYSNVYEFASPAEEAAQLRDGFYTEFNTAVHPASRLSKADKQQWLHTLAALLDEHPQRNAYRAKLLDDAGRVHHASGSLEDALELYQQSLVICQEIGDKAGEGGTLNNISQIYATRGDYAAALNYLEQSLSISRELDDKAGEGTMLNNISQIYSARGDYATALKHLEQSLAIHREVGNRVMEGTTLNNIGDIYRVQGDYGTALKHLEQSLSISREIGDKAGESARLNNLATIAYAKGDYATALKYLEQSLAICKEIGHKAGEGTTLNNIGQIYHDRGDYAAALTYLEQNLVLFREIGAKREEAGTNWNIGLTYKDQGDLSKAELYMSRAVQLKEEIGHPKLEKDRKALAELRAQL